MKQSPWHGKLNLVYGYEQGKTQVNHSFSQAPLKIQRAFYPEGESVCHSVILHTAGGIVGGDMLSIDVELTSQSKALITTVAATKVYGSNGDTAKQRVNLKIAPQATMEWFPQESIIFKGALYEQTLLVDLAEGAHFLGWEITRFGRTARGEKFLSGCWRSHTEIWQGGKPVVIDPQKILGCEDSCDQYNALAGQPILGSFIYQGDSISREMISKIRECLGNESENRVTKTLGLGIMCRYRGASTQEVRHKFTQVWELLRQNQLGRKLVKPRVWV